MKYHQFRAFLLFISILFLPGCFDDNGISGIFIILIILIIPLFIPTFIAYSRDHENKGWIFTLNIFIGWDRNRLDSSLFFGQH